MGAEDTRRGHCVVVGKSSPDFEGSIFAPLLQTFGRLNRQDDGRFHFAGMSSDQLPKQASGTPSLTPQKLTVENPPVDPVAYRELYRRDSTHRACVDAKVAYIAGQGWRLRPVAELFGNDQFVSPGSVGEPDPKQRERALAFLKASEPDFSLSQLLQMVETDCQAEGNGYLEVSRDSDGTPTRLYYAPAETMRIMMDYSGFVQVRGNRKAFWARYGTGAKSIKVTKASEVSLEDNAQFVSQAVGDLPLAMRGLSSNLGEWFEKAAAGDTTYAAVNEMMHFSIFSPKDTNYGEPCILSAIEDLLGNQNMKIMTLTYFDRCGVPRLAILVEGDELNTEVTKTLETWANSQDKLEAMNQIMVLEVPPGVAVKIEKLSSEQLQDAAFLDYRRMNDESIMRTHRTPESILATAANSNRSESSEANKKFVTGVIRPRQEVYMSKINYLLREELGVTDWVFDLNVPDLESEKVKAEISEIYLQGGARTINEVRRSDGLSGIDGGDQAHRVIPGTGLVFVGNFDKLAEIGQDRVSPNGVATTAGQKTPEKGVDPVLEAGG